MKIFIFFFQFFFLVFFDEFGDIRKPTINSKEKKMRKNKKIEIKKQTK